MRKTRGRFWSGRPPDRQSVTSTLHDATHLTLTALKESSDAFPPLKSAVGGVLHLLELCDTVKSNQEECIDLWNRANEILDRIADAVPDPTQISPDLLARIEDFTRTLDNIQAFMECLQRRKVWSRVLRNKKDEARIIALRRQLDAMLTSLILISSIKTEMTVTRHEDRIIAQALVQEVRYENTLLEIRGTNQMIKRYTFLFGGPPDASLLDGLLSSGQLEDISFPTHLNTFAWKRLTEPLLKAPAAPSSHHPSALHQTVRWGPYTVTHMCTIPGD